MNGKRVENFLCRKEEPEQGNIYKFSRIEFDALRNILYSDSTRTAIREDNPVGMHMDALISEERVFPKCLVVNPEKSNMHLGHYPTIITFEKYTPLVAPTGSLCISASLTGGFLGLRKKAYMTFTSRGKLPEIVERALSNALKSKTAVSYHDLNGHIAPRVRIPRAELSDSIGEADIKYY